MITQLFWGLDLGKRRDFTALVVARRRVIRQAWDPFLAASRQLPRLEIVRAERFPLGTPYLDIAENLAHRVRCANLLGMGVRVAVDATGVGEGVVEMMELEGLRGNVWPVIVTGNPGNHDGGKIRGYHYTATKTQLFYGLRAAMEQKITAIAEGAHGAAELVRELRNVEEGWTVAGNRSISGKAHGHDDLAFAAALAQWAARQVYPNDAYVNRTKRS